MGISDLLLYPIYVAIFYFIFKARRKKYTDPVLKFYHLQGFWIKALAVIPFTLFNYKISLGDSYVLYHMEGANIYHMILHDFTNIKWLFAQGKDFDEALLKDVWNLGYFNDENNYMVARIVAILSFLTFGKYMVTNLIFSMISFAGVWRLFRFFYEQYPHLHKQLAISILYLPTFVFWSSGILKDPLCTGAIGWITFSLFEALYKKKDIFKNFLIVFFFCYLLAKLKIYILISYLPFFVLFLVLKNVNLIKNIFVKILLVPALIIFSVLIFTKAMDKLKGTLGDYAGEGLSKSIKSYQQAYESQASYAESNFSLGVTYDGSVGSLIKMAPAAIVATLYRPFIWETRKLSTLITSLESLFIMLFTFRVLYSVGVTNFIRSIVKDPTILYCILFSLLFALFVGATTLNFGTLVRYKIPCMPFYLIALYLIMDRNKKIKKRPLKNIAE